MRPLSAIALFCLTSCGGASAQDDTDRAAYNSMHPYSDNVAMTNDRWPLIIARAHAQTAYADCPEKWVEKLISQRESAESIAAVALNLCNQEEMAFLEASVASMPGNEVKARADGAAWVADRKADIRLSIVSSIMLFRSSEPTP